MKTKTMLLSTIATVALASATLLAADEQEKNRGQWSRTDYKFARGAAQSGLFEVEAGKLATTKATNPKIKEFGQRMVTDHEKAGTDLKALATKKNAVLPTELGKDERDTLEKLQKLSGKEFDDAYAKEMKAAHRKNLRQFQNAAKDAEDPELRAFASATETVIQQHHATIKSIAGAAE